MTSDYLASPWKTIIHALSVSRGKIALMLVCIIIGNGLANVLPYFFKLIADRVAAHVAAGAGAPALTLGDFATPLWLIGATLIIHELAYRTGHIIETFATTDAFSFITGEIYGGLIRRPTSYFENKFSGDLGRRVEQVGTAVIYFIEWFPWEMGWIAMSLIVSGALLAATNALVFWVFVAWLVYFLATSYPLLRWHHRRWEEAATMHARLSGGIVDALANIPLVHSFGGVPHEERLNREAVGDVVVAERRARWISIVNKFHQGTSIGLLGFSLTITSIYLFARGQFTVGDFVIVAAIIPSLMGVVWTMGEATLRASKNFGNISDAVAHLREEQEKLRGGDVGHAPGDRYDLSFETVTFQYPGTSAPVFRDFSMKIAQGEHVGIVGPSGAGKSTLIKLLLRQYEAQAGRITVGGVGLPDLTLAAFRDLVAYVPQDTSLFHRSLFANILYARPGAPREAVIEASKRARADDFIMSLPEGYETLVGERGVKLSGGQRQRIALARAMLKDAPILVLDEATSSLDTESEAIVQEALGELFRNRTVIAIAHRLSTLRAMDRIVVMQDGAIVESGAPADLLARANGIFKKMWEQQKNGFI